MHTIQLKVNYLERRRVRIKHTNLTFSSLELACDRILSNLASMVDQGWRAGRKQRQRMIFSCSIQIGHAWLFLSSPATTLHKTCILMPAETSSPVDQATLDAVAALQQLSQDPSNKTDQETKLVCKWEDCGRVFPDHSSFKTHLSEGKFSIGECWWLWLWVVVGCYVLLVLISWH